jgi:hypothetical protein
MTRRLSSRCKGSRCPVADIRDGHPAPDGADNAHERFLRCTTGAECGKRLSRIGQGKVERQSDRVEVPDAAEFQLGPFSLSTDQRRGPFCPTAAGALPIAVANGYRPAGTLRAAGAVVVVEDLMELAALLVPPG